MAASLLVLAACGSSSVGGASSSSGGTINLGLLGPLTGARATVGQGMVTGAQVAVSLINDSGGVNGQKVNLVVQDDAADPGDAVPAAQKEINADNVVAIVGPTSLTDSVVLPLADKAKIPNLMWGGGAAFDNVSDPNFFRMSPSDTEQAYAMAVYAHQKGWDKVALAIGNTSADQSLVPGIQAAAQKLGMTITSQVAIAVGSTSFRSEIQQLYSQQPQAILAQFDIPSTGTMFSELKQQNLLSTPWVASNLWFAAEFPTTVSPAVAAGPVYIANSGTENKGFPAFSTALQKYKNTTQVNNGETYMWDAVTAWALGAQEAGTTDSPAVEKGILKIANGPGTSCYDYAGCLSLLKAGKSINFQGASSSVDFDGHHNVFGPFDIVHYNVDGTSSTLQTLTPQEIQTALGL
jgi:neutral amino acid transport system substrate-binding protein